jgi:uncharacterized protein (TIGR00369 family)
MQKDFPAPQNDDRDWQELDTLKNPFLLLVGPLLRRRQGNKSEYAFRTTERHSNVNGVVHGGMLATFADQSLGHTALQATGGCRIATIHLAVNFISGANVGELIQCRAEVIRKTYSLVFLRGEIYSDERTIATSEGIWKVLHIQK